MFLSEIHSSYTSRLMDSAYQLYKLGYILVPIIHVVFLLLSTISYLCIISNIHLSMDIHNTVIKALSRGMSSDFLVYASCHYWFYLSWYDCAFSFLSRPQFVHVFFSVCRCHLVVYNHIFWLANSVSTIYTLICVASTTVLI